MRLLATSDLHLGHDANREALRELADHGDDWLILAGDIAERIEHQEFAFRELARRFARLVWVPGNHDLWTVPRPGAAEPAERGEARYRLLVDLARAHGAATPEDPWPEWPGDPAAGRPPLVVVPLFLLYDYSFRPAEVARADVRRWARAGGAACGDEFLLHPDPWPSREAWCAARCDEAERRLSALPAGARTVLVNHWPLRADLVRLPRIPRFAPWCGTTRTRDWHRRFRAAAVVTGHLHTRRTDVVDGCRFEEVSLGNPGQWRRERGMARYLREIASAGATKAPPASS